MGELGESRKCVGGRWGDGEGAFPSHFSLEGGLKVQQVVLLVNIHTFWNDLKHFCAPGHGCECTHTHTSRESRLSSLDPLGPRVIFAHSEND